MAIISAGIGQRKNQEQAPIIINGDCFISQRGTAIADESTSGTYRVDRMSVGLSNIGEFRMQQESLSSGNAYAAGFKKAFRIDCVQADASPASSDIANMVYKLEGHMVQAFQKGTANAKKSTLAFWVKSNKTGTGQVNMIDSDNSRMVSGTYTISSADTWEHKIINFPADTSGVLDNDNAKSLELEWALDAGSDFTTGTAPTAWEATANADRSANDFALQDNTANDWAITGIQLEVGEYDATTLPPFQFESFADNLRRCSRYFTVTDAVGGTQAGYPARAFSSTGLSFSVPLPVPMRASPTLTLVGTLRAFAGDTATYRDSTSNLSVGYYAALNSSMIGLQSTGFSSITDNKAYNIMSINDTQIKYDAEL